MYEPLHGERIGQMLLEMVKLRFKLVDFMPKSVTSQACYSSLLLVLDTDRYLVGVARLSQCHTSHSSLSSGLCSQCM